MRGSPWYKRYPSDFIAGTVGLSLEQKGAYSLILDVIYDRGGPVPDDARYWAGLCGCSVRKWNTIKTELAAMGKIALADGFISNFRAEKEIENSKTTAEKHAKNGSKGGRKRAENEADDSKNNDLVQAGLKHTRINQKPEARDQKKEDTNVSSKRDGSDKGFEAFYQAYPRHVGKGAARKSYAAAIKKTSPGELLVAVERFAVEVAGKDPKFIPYPSTWLNGERWTDDAAAASAETGDDDWARREAEIYAGVQ